MAESSTLDLPNTIQDSLAPLRPLGAQEDPVVKQGPQTHGILKFVLDSFGLGSVITIEGVILDSCYEIWT